MHCVVQKPFSGNGVDYQSNWLVDTGSWPIRRRDQLISQRFIRIASEEEISSASEEEASPRRSSPRPRKRKTTAKKQR
jgi:hypothetical protein